VTRHHAIESGGGLYFSSSEDLGAVTEYFLSNPGAREKHAAAGRCYVEREYGWDAVLRRYDSALANIFAAKLEVVPSQA
jgi:glycosyltransferase involved in cell wall biosynthesis